MGIVERITSHIVVNREINREGWFAFRSNQRRISSTKHHLSDMQEAMKKTNTFTSTETYNPACGGEPKEVREVILSDKGIFEKIKYLSSIDGEQVYNMLLKNGAFIQATINNGEIKSIIYQDECGIYRELHTFPKKTKDKVFHFVREVIKLLDEMLESDNLPNDEN